MSGPALLNVATQFIHVYFRLGVENAKSEGSYWQTEPGTVYFQKPKIMSDIKINVIHHNSTLVEVVPADESQTVPPPSDNRPRNGMNKREDEHSLSIQSHRGKQTQFTQRIK